MKKLYSLLLVIFTGCQIYAQQNYCDFEGTKVISFGDRTGFLDTMALNPAPNAINLSPNCAKYIRDTTLYDNFKINTSVKMADITPYANNTFSTPKITMKLYSSAPAGTLIQLQLGTSTNNTYPAGVHSEYIAATTAQHAWQNITFNYYQSPSGSTTPATAVDKMVIFFRANSSVQDTIYIDDISGPPLVNTGIAKNESAAFKLYQNSPNPAKDRTTIKVQMNSSGPVSMKLYDMIGNLVMPLIDQNLSAGVHLIPVETANIPNGIYFYELKKEGTAQTMKMIISN